MLNRILAFMAGVAAAFIMATSASAEYVPFYREQVGIGTGSTSGTGSGPHEAAVVYGGQVGGVTQKVTLSSSPVPFISTEVSRSEVSQSGIAAADMVYSVGVSGPVSTAVPITFSGIFTQIYAANNSGTNSIYVSEPAGYFGRNCGSSGCYVYGSGISVQMIDEQHGMFNGQISIQTDASGFGQFVIGIYAQSVIAGYGSGDYAYAYLDPSFQIDAAFLSQNPNTELLFPAGVGNSTGTVNEAPEPGTYMLMLAGFGALALARRRRTGQ